MRVLFKTFISASSSSEFHPRVLLKVSAYMSLGSLSDLMKAINSSELQSHGSHLL